MDDGPDTFTGSNTGATTPGGSNTSKRAQPRGKRAKKLAKYAEQDEEDRLRNQSRLGHMPGQQDSMPKVLQQKLKEEEAQAQKQRRREQHLRIQAAGRAAEEARQFAMKAATSTAEQSETLSEEVADGEQEQRESIHSLPLDCLIGKPLAGDRIICAIPVCAPWSALSSYKYKVKLQPGTVKKGKAVKEILSRWETGAKDPKAVDPEARDQERMWPAEIESIRAWKEAEVFGIIPVKSVRVMLSGGLAGGSGGGGQQKGKGKAPRVGKGSKKQR
jgi:hypothetical protein